MIVVDAGPLIALARVDRLEILEIYGDLIAPPEVIKECVSDIVRPGALLIRVALRTGFVREHPHARLVAGNLLHAGERRVGLLAGRDPGRTVLPGALGLLDVARHLLVAAALEPQQIALSALANALHVVGRHHAAVADEHRPLDAAALLHVVKHRFHGLRVAQVAAKHMMGDRPTIDLVRRARPAQDLRRRQERRRC